MSRYIMRLDDASEYMDVEKMAAHGEPSRQIWNQTDCRRNSQ